MRWSLVQKYLSKSGYISQLLRRIIMFIESDKCQYDGKFISNDQTLELAKTISSHLDVPANEIGSIRNTETKDMLAFLNESIKYIDFVGRTKDYGKKVQEVRRKKEEKLIKQERMKERAIKGVEANSRVVKDIIENSPKLEQKFETKVNMMIFEEGDKAADEIRAAEKGIEEKLKYINDLKKLKKNMIHQVTKESEERKRKEKKEEDRSYMEYQRELVIFIL